MQDESKLSEFSMISVLGPSVQLVNQKMNEHIKLKNIPSKISDILNLPTAYFQNPNSIHYVSPIYPLDPTIDKVHYKINLGNKISDPSLQPIETCLQVYSNGTLKCHISIEEMIQFYSYGNTNNSKTFIGDFKSPAVNVQFKEDKTIVLFDSNKQELPLTGKLIQKKIYGVDIFEVNIPLEYKLNDSTITYFYAIYDGKLYGGYAFKNNYLPVDFYSKSAIEEITNFIVSHL